jgi:hypothetical protein
MIVDFRSREEKAMNDEFEGTWGNLKCHDPFDIEQLLAKMDHLKIHNDHVKWHLKTGADLDSTMYEKKNEKLSGHFLLGGHQYYFEVSLRTPPSSLTQPKHYIYGIVSPINGNGDLGDPGTWTAQESGGENPDS